MNDRSPNDPERKVLPEPLATRVLSRAIELEQARSAGSTVADLRAAAGEVGVSTDAFNAALAEVEAFEVEASERTPTPVVAKRPQRSVRLPAIVASLIAIFAFFVFMRVPNQQAAAIPKVPMIEDAVLLRCLSPEEAAQLVRPVLDMPENSAVARSTNGSRVLAIRATQEQWQKVRSVLDQHEAAGSAACSARPGSSPPG